MLERRKDKRTVPLWLPALALMLLVGGLFAAPPAAGQPGYTVLTNPNATRTVTWNLSDSSAFSLDNVSLSQGKAQLNLVNQSLAWTGGPDFAANGTWDSNLTPAAEGIELAANETNLVPDGDFSSLGSWSYTNSTDDNVTATWEASSGTVRLGHASNSTQTLWDGLDEASLSNWTCMVSAGTSCVFNEVTGGQKQGSGMFELNVTVPNGSSSFAMTNATAQVNRSRYDTLLIWVNLTTPAPIAFNISATNGTRKYWTATQTLASGWHDLVVNLTPLGPARTMLSNLEFRFMPASPGSCLIYIDDIRLAQNVRFNGSASIGQLVSKPAATSAAPGTAQLSFDWEWTNQSGVRSAASSLTFDGPAGPLVFPLSAVTMGAWSHARVDVSPQVASPGIYNISVTSHLSANTTEAVDAQIVLDNITLLFPDRQNGTYVSGRIDLGTNNLLQNASLNLSLPEGTNVNVTLAGSMQPNPYGSAWDFEVSLNGSAPLDLQDTVARYIELTARMNTTNRSETPTLRGFVLNGRHYPASGTLTTAPLTPDSAFLFWSHFDAKAEVLAMPTDTNMLYYINPGTGWLQVYPGEDIPHYTNRVLRVRVVLESSVGWFTPLLDALSVTYDFLGPLSAIHVTPTSQSVVTGGTLQFTATAVDVGDHPNQTVVFTWATDDPGGSVSPTGLFRAGQPGTWNVTAFSVATNPGYSDTVQVTVVAAITPASAFPLETVVLGAGIIALVAGLGYAIFEFGVRRAFAIDDFFLIARDGRLMSHNTRRLLPDQDEDTLSGMLTAINSFVRDAWREENGHIRRMVFGGKTTLVERGKHVFLAAVYSGRVPSWASRDLKSFITDLEAHFGSAFERWSGSPEDLQQLREVMGRFASHLRYSRRRVWRPMPEAA